MPVWYEGRSDPEERMKLAVEHRERKEVLQYLEELSEPLPRLEGVWATAIFHGVTNFEVAEQISQTGFAANVQRTKGWFGEGPYASTSALYACRYSLGMQEAWEKRGSRGYLVAGRACWSQAYPVTQADNTEDEFTPGLKGQPVGGYGANGVASGCDAHFACVRGHAPCGDEGRRTYHACRAGERPDFTELVVREECQLIPDHIIEVEVTQDENALLRAKWEAESWGRNASY